jgi:hypothetical protein
MSPMTPDEAASIVERRGEPTFLDLWRGLATDFEDARFADDLTRALRADPALATAWTIWSEDQRWTPSAYVAGVEAGWFDGARQHVRHHDDEAAAVADFIRRIARWLSSRDADYANAEV